MVGVVEQVLPVVPGRRNWASMFDGPVGSRTGWFKSLALRRGFRGIKNERKPAQRQANEDQNDEDDDARLIESKKDFFTLWHGDSPEELKAFVSLIGPIVREMGRANVLAVHLGGRDLAIGCVHAYNPRSVC